MKIPFKDDANIRNQFIRARGSGIRIGRLLELLDYVAGMVSYKFAKAQVGQGAIMVTACVDHFEIFQEKIDETKDLYVTVLECNINFYEIGICLLFRKIFYGG